MESMPRTRTPGGSPLPELDLTPDLIPDLTPELGPMLAEARMRCGWRGREAARLLGISRSQLVGLEAGLRSPDTTLAERLAEGLALTPHESALLLAAATAHEASGPGGESMVGQTPPRHDPR